MSRRFASFAEFYPYYLAQHRNRTSRLLHLVGLVLGLGCLAYAVIAREWIALGFSVLFGYGLGWTGHFVFEHNRPASFGHPFYSFLGDIRMAIGTLGKVSGKRGTDEQHVGG